MRPDGVYRHPITMEDPELYRRILGIENPWRVTSVDLPFYWRWRSRPRDGRPQITEEIRVLVLHKFSNESRDRTLPAPTTILVQVHYVEAKPKD